MNPLLISALLSAAISFGAAWQIQGWRMDSYKLEVANEQLDRERATQQAVADAQTKIAAAQASAQEATDRIKRDAAGATRAAVGMRDTLSRSVVAAHTDLQACTGQVTTLSELLGTVVDAGGRMAKEADEWTVQALTLQGAK